MRPLVKLSVENCSKTSSWYDYPSIPPFLSLSPLSTMDECLVQCKATWPFCQSDFSMFPYERVKCRNVRLNTFLLIFHLIIFWYWTLNWQGSLDNPVRRYRLPIERTMKTSSSSPAYHNIYNISAWMFECLNWRILMFTYTYLLGWAAWQMCPPLA